MAGRDLAERVAVVTGASAGIGRAIAMELATRGAGVVVNARRRERLVDLAGAIRAAHEGARVEVAAGDCAEQATIDAMLDIARRAFGREADLVVVNAGRGLSGSVMTSDTSQWEEMVRTNLLGAARLMRSAGERMLAELEAAKADGAKAGDGKGKPAWLARPHDIIALGSVVGRHVSPFSSMYGSTKFGVHGLAEGQRRELAGRGIRVTVIEPGFVVSEFQQVAGYDPAWFEERVAALGPMLEPADIARAVGFVASQPAHVHVSDVLVRPTRQEYP
ncbi:MAG: SDR family oxidoreductase [Phycisphaerales bacterium]